MKPLPKLFQMLTPLSTTHQLNRESADVMPLSNTFLMLLKENVGQLYSRKTHFFLALAA